MKLIIDVPEEIYKASQIVDAKNEDVIQIPLEVIANGTPLPDDCEILTKEAYSDLCLRASKEESEE